jgi:hypothetical protein
MGRKRIRSKLFRRLGAGIGHAILKHKIQVKLSPTGPIPKHALSQVGFPEAIPAELAGKYAVWSPDGLGIVGSASTIEEALVIASRVAGRLVQRVPSVSRPPVVKRTLPTTIES